jgi:hypothetical protein
MERFYRDAQLEAAALKPRPRRGRRRRSERRRQVRVGGEEQDDDNQNASADARTVVQLSGNLNLRFCIWIRTRSHFTPSHLAVDFFIVLS